MKALSIRQPWAWAILSADKRIENRARADGRMPDMCRHRGPILIHASKGCTWVELEEAARWILRLGHRVPRLDGLDRGGIVGRARVVGHVDPSGAVIHGLGAAGLVVDMRWHVPGSYGLVLADVGPLAFVPWKGSLGLFDVPLLDILGANR